MYFISFLQNVICHGWWFELWTQYPGSVVPLVMFHFISFSNLTFRLLINLLNLRVSELVFLMVAIACFVLKILSTFFVFIRYKLQSAMFLQRFFAPIITLRTKTFHLDDVCISFFYSSILHALDIKLGELNKSVVVILKSPTPWLAGWGTHPTPRYPTFPQLSSF